MPSLSASVSADARQTITVLSIDDTPTFRQLIRLTLEFAGFRVIEASDGQQGLSLAQSSVPDLILLDLMMPVMDGVAVCQHIMGSPHLRHIPVVVLSSSEDSDEIETCLVMGATNYLLKPFRPQMLIDVVRQSIQASGSRSVVHSTPIA